MLKDLVTAFVVAVINPDTSIEARTVVALDESGLAATCVVLDSQRFEFVPCGENEVAERYLISIKELADDVYSVKLRRVVGDAGARPSLRISSAANIADSGIVRMGQDDRENIWEARRMHSDKHAPSI